jgi:hypothetical protein
LNALNYPSRLQFLTIWVLGLPLGVYFAFFAMLVYGLEGLWFGVLTGLGLQCSILFIILLTIDWKKESRKLKYYHRVTDHSTQFYPYEDVVLPIAGSYSLGGFQLYFSNAEEELLEIEAIELGEP